MNTRFLSHKPMMSTGMAYPQCCGEAKPDLGIKCVILGREGKIMVGISKNLDGGFRGDVTVDGDLITIDCSPYTAGLGIFSGRLRMPIT